MATYYHGATRRRSYFEGWYLKHQTQSGRALSLIPALHIDAEGRRTASLQVITENACWWLEYPELLAEERRFRIQLGENLFDSEGVRLQIRPAGAYPHRQLVLWPFHASSVRHHGPIPSS